MKILQFIFFITLLINSVISQAAGPIRSFFGGTCKPLDSNPKLCREAGERWLVKKADGSGTMVMGFVRSNPGYKGLKKASKSLGFRGKMIKRDKEYYKAKKAWGLIHTQGNEPVEPPIYRQILPISDQFALAQPHDLYSVYDSPYYVVPIDGKVTKLGEPIGKKSIIYVVGGYSMQSPVRVFVNRGTTSVGQHTRRIEQLDAKGQVVATYDNIIVTSAKLTFFTQNETGVVFAKAIDPKTGNEASMRWGPMGEFLGYFPKIDFVESFYDLGRQKSTTYLMQAVGRLPIKTDLPDSTIYLPLDEHGEPITGPENFVGMTPLYDNHWYYSETQQKHKDWLLVYKTPSGFGYKVAGVASRGPVGKNSEYSPISILASEADYVMLADFDYRREFQSPDQPPIKYIWNSNFVQLYTAYEEDGVTPKPNAHPGKWHALGGYYRYPVTLDNKRRLEYAAIQGPNKEGWDDKFSAIRATYQDTVDFRADQIARKRAYEAQIAEAERRRDEERKLAHEAAKREWREHQEYLAAHPERNQKSWSQKFAEGLNAWGDSMIKQSQQKNNSNYQGYRTECYNNYDGTETCYTSKK